MLYTQVCFNSLIIEFFLSTFHFLLFYSSWNYFRSLYSFYLFFSLFTVYPPIFLHGPRSSFLVICFPSWFYHLYWFFLTIMLFKHKSKNEYDTDLYKPRRSGKKLDAYMVINLAFLSYVMYELFLYFVCWCIILSSYMKHKNPEKLLPRGFLFLLQP